MSAYKTVETKMTDLGTLARALEHVKPEWKGKIEAAQPGKTVTIKGDTTVQGELVIKKDKINTYGDIGVVRGKDGNFTMWISDVDNGSYFKDSARRANEGKLFDQGFIDKVAQAYGLFEGVGNAVNAGWEAINQTPVELNAPIPGLVGKINGIRMRIPKSMVMQQ
jgi:hypothetical protein